MWFRERRRGSVLLDVRRGIATGVRLLRGGAAPRRSLLPRLWDPGRGNGAGPGRGTTRRERVVRRRDRVDRRWANALDPEQLRDVMATFFGGDARGDRGRRRHGGEVHRRRRDGGVRRAVGSRGRPARGRCAPRSACGAGSRRSIPNSTPTHGLTLQMRIGVNTGEVLAAGDAASGEPMVTGDVVTPRPGCRPPPNPARSWPPTAPRRAVRGFRFGERRDLALKGKSESVVASAVLGGSGEAADVRAQWTDGGARRRTGTAPLDVSSAPPPRADRTSSRSTATRGSASAG